MHTLPSTHLRTKLLSSISTSSSLHLRHKPSISMFVCINLIYTSTQIQQNKFSHLTWRLRERWQRQQQHQRWYEWMKTRRKLSEFYSCHSPSPFLQFQPLQEKNTEQKHRIKKQNTSLMVHVCVCKQAFSRIHKKEKVKFLPTLTTYIKHKYF